MNRRARRRRRRNPLNTRDFRRSLLLSGHGMFCICAKCIPVLDRHGFAKALSRMITLAFLVRPPLVVPRGRAGRKRR